MRYFILLITIFCYPAVHGQVLLEQERWPNGELRHMTFEQGNRLFFVSYYENGTMKEQGCFRNGRQDGVWKQFTENGTMLAQAYFNNGEPHGVWKFRDQANKPIGQLQFRNGLLKSGEQYRNGELVALRTYR